MSGKESPKTAHAREILRKNPRLTNKQVALRAGITASYVRRLRNQMEVEK